MKKGMFVRLSDEELEILRKYCVEVERTQSDVIRDFVRRLKKKLPSSDKSTALRHGLPKSARTSSTSRVSVPSTTEHCASADEEG